MSAPNQTQAPKYCLFFLFLLIISILSENYGRYYLAEAEYDKISKQDTISQSIVKKSSKPIIKQSKIIKKKKTLNHKYYKNLELLAAKAKQYTIKHGLSRNYCILVDYSLPSGIPRCFLWNFNSNKLEAEIHALHGSGGKSTAEKAEFSNKINSNCSSLGHYKITKQRGYTYPRGFYMCGLDKTNSNARVRSIMIHPSTWADHYKDYEYIPLGGSLGCVSITTEGINILEPIILRESKLLLLWAFTSCFPTPFEAIIKMP